MAFDKENKDTVNFMIILSVAGLLVKLFMEKSKPAEASIWGYGVTAIAVLVMMVVTLANHTSLTAFKEVKTPISILALSIPSFFTILLLIWLIMLNTSFAELIDSGKYSGEYKYFSIFETVMMIIQVIVVFLIASAEDVGKVRNYKTVIYITSVLNIVFIGMMNIILYFFTTDG